MPYSLDPEVGASLAELAADGTPPVPARGDWQTLRKNGNAGQAYLASITPTSEGVTTVSYATASPDGGQLELRWYRGGMVLGNLDSYDTLLSWYVATTGVPFLSVGYRLAPESQGETLAEDVFAGLVWLREHAAELGVAVERIAVMGDSGGGSPAAGAAILARDRGIPLAAQLLIYPMLDDRTTVPDAALTPFATWTYDNNWTAWTAVLGDARGTDAVSSIVAPARLADAAGLAPAYLEVGELDVFRDEDIAYAAKLAQAAVPVELHVHPGAPHGFDRFSPNSALTRRAMADRARVIASI
jgi:acetyl esterase/lipase